MKNQDVIVHTMEHHRIDPLEHKRYDDMYTTCCSKNKTDARLIRLISRFSLSIITISFAGIQLVRAGPCDSLTPFYSSLITFILGSWLKVDNQQRVSDNLSL